MSKDTAKVLLLSMPWTSLIEPSLGLGILKAQLNKVKISCTIKHFNIFFLKHISASTYTSICNLFALNDFLFSAVLEKEISAFQLKELSRRIKYIIDDKSFQDERYKTEEEILGLLVHLRNEVVPAFLEDCMDTVRKSSSTMVGFTCMFDQTIASLALAKLIKEEFPEKQIVLGGYALEPPTGEEVLKAFPFVDCVAYGEGEKLIENLAKASVDQSLYNSIKNIHFRRGDELIRTSSIPFINLNESPIPDYDDFVVDVDELEEQHKIKVSWKTLPIETSRGCWWGQTKHCIFCGIDDVTMKYREKNTETTMKMLFELKKRYGLIHFRISDYILPNTFYNGLLPILGELEEKLIFSCEMKANITEEKFISLKNAGFVELQPGIESFSTSVLKKVDKGVSAIQNAYCLLLGIKYQIHINYNFLFGFPEDTPEEYEEILKIMPLLYHCHPPSGRSRVAMTRFAPLQTNSERFGIDSVSKHERGYDILFSPDYLEQSGFNLDNFCYYFETPYRNSKTLSNLYQLTVFQIDYWKSIHQDESKKAYLIYETSENGIIFRDTRFGKEKCIELGADVEMVYEACAGILIAKSQLYSQFSKMDTEQIDNIIASLKKHRLLMEEGSKIIGLALLQECYELETTKDRIWESPYV